MRGRTASFRAGARYAVFTPVAPGASNMFDAAADQSTSILWLVHLMHAICGLMYVLVLLAVAVVVWRAWRQARGDAPTPSDRALTLGLRVWIGAVVLGLVLLTGASFLIDRALIPGADPALMVRITGKQWWWQIEYLDPDPSKQFSTANELHLPVDRTVHVVLQSADVIHSFWVPNLSGKRDLIPGRINTIALTPRRTGTFRGACAEFCGLQHARMALRVDVEDGAAFARWRARQLAARSAPQDDATRDGERLFEQGTCAMCHAIRGTSAQATSGPDLTHLASRKTLAAASLPLDRGTLTAWLADPQRLKPGTNMPKVDLSPDERNALVTYLLSLE